VETAISGALVPNATMVSPTTSGESPRDKASFDAPRTNAFAPNTSAANPAANQKACIQSIVVYVLQQFRWLGL
jgi:hypothetical protein